jgi:hypothetical protein
MEHKNFHDKQNKAFKRAAPRRSGRPSWKWNRARGVPKGKAVNSILTLVPSASEMPGF